MEARKAWARDRLIERIDAEIAGLESHFETLDFETIELDRAESGERALFDPSREACLARRYESEARRGFFKALKDFRQAEAEIAERVASAPPASAIPPDSRLASSCAGSSPDLHEQDEAPLKPTPPAVRPISTGVLSETEVALEKTGRLSPAGRLVPATA